MADGEARVVAGRYRLLAELGRGGMGVVWLAEDQLVGRRVAVKELRPYGETAADRDTAARRALAEARNAARVHHPGAVTLYDVLPASDADDAVYLIMEFVQGPTLAQVIGRQGRLAEAVVAGFGLQLLSVLEAAHALGVVHRDIKPANILIAAGGRLKLTDFGIAYMAGDLRLTRSGIMGTQAYLAPELFESAPIAPAADIWSLGATLYAAAEGRGPFERDSASATLRAILVDDPPTPRCSPALAAAIAGMLQRDPARRAGTGQARAALQAAAQAAPSLAPATVPPVTVRPATAPATAPATSAPATSAQPAPVPGTDHGTVPQPAWAQPQPTWPQPQWAQLPTTVSPTPPPAPPRSPGPQPPSPSQPGVHRRTVILAAAIAAAVLAAAAITGGILVTSHHPTSHPKLLATLSAPPDGGSVAFSPDGQTLATTDEGRVYLWSTTSHSLSKILHDPGGQSVTTEVFSPDGRTLAIGDNTRHTYLVNIASRAVTATLTGPGSYPDVTWVAFSPDGRTVTTGYFNLHPSSSGSFYENNIYLWSSASGKNTATLTDPGTQGPTTAAFSPDGQTLAVADSNGRIYLWDVATRRVTATLSDPNSQGVFSVAFSANGQTLAAADGNGRVYLWNATTRSRTATLPVPRGSSSVGWAALSPDGQTLAASYLNSRFVAGKTVYLWSTASGKITAKLTDPDSQSPVDLAFSPDSQTLAIADENGRTYLWQVPQGG